MSDYLETITCGECGCVFGLQSYHLKALQKDAGDFYCPNGHLRTFAESEADRLKTQLREKKAELEQTNSQNMWLRDTKALTERRLSATQGVVTRIKNRVSNGVCPCCNRTFQNLQRHMHSKHPDYSQSETA